GWSPTRAAAGSGVRGEAAARCTNATPARGDVAQRRETAALPQPRDRRSTDVDEVRAADRQPRTQTRTDLEPRGRRGGKHREFRPRIESVRGDQVPRGPGRVVEVTVGGPCRTRAVGILGKRNGVERRGAASGPV